MSGALSSAVGSIASDATGSSAQGEISQMQQVFEQAVQQSMQITEISTMEKTKLDATKQRPQN